MRVQSCFQRLEQRYALLTAGPARADRFGETVSPAPADLVRTTLFSLNRKAKNRPRHQTIQPFPERIKITKNSNLKPHNVLPMF